MVNNKITPKVSHLFLKTSHGSPMEPVDNVNVIAGEGLSNDISRGRRLRQILIIDSHILDEFDLEPGILRENITVEGISISNTTPGTIIYLGDVQLEVALDCAPCELLEEIKPGLKNAMIGKRGMLCKALTSGTITIGDKIQIDT